MSTNIWDYVLEAAKRYASDCQSALDEGSPASAFAEPVIYWMNRAASDGAHEYHRMVTEIGLPKHVADVAIQLNTDMVMAISAAREILGTDYAEWQQNEALKLAHPNASL